MPHSMPLVTVKVSNNAPHPGPVSGGAPDAASPSEAARAGGGVALAHQQRGAAGARAPGAAQAAPAAGMTPAGRPNVTQPDTVQPKTARPNAAPPKTPRGVDPAQGDGYELRAQPHAPTSAKLAPAPTAGAAAAMPRPQGAHTGVPARTLPSSRPATTQGAQRTAGRTAARSSRTAAQGEANAAPAGGRKARSEDDDPARTVTGTDARRGPWTSAGTLAPPAVRPDAPGPFSASVTALGYAAAARRMQAQAAPMQRALRAPIADAPRPSAKGQAIGVTVGGRSASPPVARI